ncbi:hypothetical protein Q5424_18630 [Conexibacter sp. JD483]|uniref:hypothetical protein n=1 Tax=unclassified Conexibacter TaxID=2627773 RepID=UPI0027273C78|nr:MULTISPECIES: hypothetical protein [unclassified Conexibacter]MDO8184088.1 hypothetical protein [Conexibacter sp. CPCC 205706]MDO8197080.1 hypothetical protein [Conexibacter sp. CPCC 205762]MDR9371119.1 hypothetical protein [Conexibacter sp. JD483]
MAILYSDTFSSRTPNAFWNANSGVTFTGSAASIAAGGRWIGARGLTGSFPLGAGLFREIVWQVTAGDRPGFVGYNAASDEIVSLTFAAGTLFHRVNGGSWSRASYTSAHQWRRVRLRSSGVTVSTSPDGTTWTDVVTIGGAPFPDYLDQVYMNSAGGGVGNGTSSSATVIDNFTWQDYAPAAIALTTSVLDDAQRADENPLSDGGLWDSPGFPDHDACAIVSRRIVGIDRNGGAIWKRAFSDTGRGVETWADVGDVSSSAEYTLFTALQSDYVRLGRRGYNCWITGTRLWLVRFDPGNDSTTLINGAAVLGSGLAAGDRLGLIVAGGLVSVALRRSGGSDQLIGQIADSGYRSGLAGIALIVAGSFARVGGGTR